MKLYFWNNPYSVKYGGSSVCAVAETADEARAIAKSNVAKTLNYGSPTQEASDMSGIALGAPTLVLDLPCAVWDEWSE